MTKLLGVALCLATLLAPPAFAVDPVTEIGSSSFSMWVGGYVLQVPYEANTPLSGSYAQVQRAVVLVPGSNRNASFAHETLLEAATIAGMNDDTSLLVAPQFLIEADVNFHLLPADRLFWTESGWKQGDASLSTAANPRPATLSSFAVLDSILYRIAFRNPNLQSIVVAGHSAGGQFIQRFAAGSTAEQALQTEFGIQLAYIVANPSSYLYFNTERVVSGTQDQFAMPPANVVQSCPHYDEYKYGMQARNAYMSRLAGSQIVSRYPARRVTYLLGEQDRDPASQDLDTTCPAMLQGSNRLERGLIYGHYLRHIYGANTHRTVLVFGVGHDSRAMFTSTSGVAQLFGTTDAVAVEPGAIGADRKSPCFLGQSHPNPFRTRTTIVYRLPDGLRNSTLRVYDSQGRLVRTLHVGPSIEGSGSIVWDGRSNAGQRVSAGLYFFRLQSGQETFTRRVTLLR